MHHIPKSVGMFLSPDYWFVHEAIARFLKKEYGTKIWLYVGCKQDLKYLTLDRSEYDGAIVHNAQAYPYKKIIDKAAIEEKAKKWESFLNTTIQELMMASRIYGRGYALAGYYYPRSFTSEKFCHHRTLDAYSDDLDFWKQEIDSKEIDLFFNPSKSVAVLCRSMGIKTRILTLSRHENYYYWAEDEFAINPNIEKAYKKVPVHAIPAQAELKGYNSDLVFRDTYFDYGIKNVFRDFVHAFLKRFIDHIRQNEARRSTYVLSETARNIRKYIDIRRMTKGKLITAPEDFIDSTFFYFPLQTEPEWTLQVQSPEFFSQLFAIALSCRALPAHVRLVVKEHIYPIGSRPLNFYDQLYDFKNIIIAPATLSGLSVTKRTRAIITINGTSGYEAAMMGIPVIVMAQRCDYAFLKHVYHCPLGKGLKEAINAILEKPYPNAASQADGARFLQSIIDCSFSLGDYSVRDRQVLPEAVAAEAYQHLLESLRADGSFKSFSTG